MKPRQIRITIIFTLLLVAAAAIFLILGKHQTQQQQQAAQSNSHYTNKLYARLDHLPLQGKADAPNHFILFEDLQCEFCKNFHQKNYNVIKKQFVDKGLANFRIVLVKIHPETQAANTLAYCIAQQNTNDFFKFTDYIYAHEAQINWLHPQEMLGVMGIKDLNSKQLNVCVNKPQMKNKDVYYLKTMLSISKQANQPGGTPSLIINRHFISPFFKTTDSITQFFKQPKEQSS
jgi:protein-disulfide isomerase